MLFDSLAGEAFAVVEAAVGLLAGPSKSQSFLVVLRSSSLALSIWTIATRWRRTILSVGSKCLLCVLSNCTPLSDRQALNLELLKKASSSYLSVSVFVNLSEFELHNNFPIVSQIFWLEIISSVSSTNSDLNFQASVWNLNFSPNEAKKHSNTNRATARTVRSRSLSPLSRLLSLCRAALAVLAPLAEFALLANDRFVVMKLSLLAALAPTTDDEKPRLLAGAIN